MITHVYANDLEIACKAAGMLGKSAGAFPDPCWSPPGPSAGPVVLPYPNTVYASTITNGTTTVFICGQEVAVEDKSYFATSTGNEPATQAFSKGVATGVITGKGYFTQWSPNVLFEGLCVPRHQDLVGHNHGSIPSNTPVFPYISRSWIWDHECDAEEKRINRACKPEDEKSDAHKELKKGSKLSQLLKKFGPKKKVGRRDGGGKHWTDDHCGGLHIPLDSAERAKEYANEMQEAIKSIPDELNLIAALEQELKDMAVNAGAKALAKVGVKAGLKQLGGSAVPLAGNIAMGLWTLWDVGVAIGDVSEIRAVANETLEKLDIMRGKLTDVQKMASDFANFDKLSDAEKLEKAQKLGTDAQDMLATLNECTRARKCNLVPYKADGAGNLIGQRGKSKVEAANNGGCCPGQTGHHLMPGASIEKTCPNYNHDIAPTVCVEGTSQNMGSHARVHQALALVHQKKSAQGKIAADGTMSLDEGLDAAAESHEKAFPLSKCSKKCIRAQLDSYYKSMCRGARPGMVDAQSKPATPGNGPL